MIRTLGRIGFVLAWVFALKTLLMGVAHSQPYTSTAPGIYVQEEDGNPSARFRRIKVPNSKLTNNSDGSCSLSFNDAVYDCTSVNACTIDAESMEGVDWGTMTDTKYCVYDLAGTEVDCNASAPAVEGTAVLSTGEEGGTKFLREDGDGTSSWQTPAGGGDLLADGTVPLTADWDVGLFDITAVEFKGALKGLADTATALAADPADCGAGAVATAIAANGNLTCSITPLVTADINTMAELDTIVADENILAETEIDASSELLAIMDDETGSASGSPLLVFNQNPTFAGMVATGLVDFGGATTGLEIPQNSASNSVGEVDIDTTSDQFGFFGAKRWVMTGDFTLCKTLEKPVEADDNIPLWNFKRAVTITDVYCEVDGGTSIDLTISDGTNALEAITCDGDGAEDDGSIANGTFTARERIEMDLSSPSGTNTWLIVCVTFETTAD